MLDGVSLDHLRTFVAAADTGSFSAAGRAIGRSQSVVSRPSQISKRSSALPCSNGLGAIRN
ncbi:helix-turn-helix domain-containing protein [Paraburkholderia caledonica]|uniref:helix-turn-helix domain-containing protein n=1 Tax=Paraburkholderia caledonica TaxID=134536 RepID=UPI0037094687